MSTTASLGPLPARTDRPGNAALKVLRVLAGADGPQTIAALTEALGGHPNSVRAHLERLIAAGYVGSSPQPAPGRGRPAQGFSATADGRRAAFAADTPDPHTALLDAIADQFGGLPDPAATALELGRAWGARLADPAVDGLPSEPGAAPAILAEALTRQGFSPEPHFVGLRLRTCPLLSAARRNPEVVCGIHQGMIEATTTTPVTLVPFAEPGGCLVRLG